MTASTEQLEQARKRWPRLTDDERRVLIEEGALRSDENKATEQEDLFADSRNEACKAIATGMGVALGLWFIPLGAGLACNAAEGAMVKNILSAYGMSNRAREERLFWFFRKKYLLVNVATYVPYAGTAVQVLEAYSLGQFVLRACEDNVNVSADAELERIWAEIEPLIWSADGVVSFYEGFSGAQFPPAAKATFGNAVQTFGAVIRGVNKVPGLLKAQETTGEAIKRATGAFKNLWRK